MPKINTVAAKGIPPERGGRFGYEVALIKTIITCEDTKKDAALCSAIGGTFGASGLNPVSAPLGAFGGLMTAFGCGMAEVGNT
jgi:hypothetical protein